MLADARNAYAKREAEIDELLAVQGGMRELERQMLLQVMDRKWREHLYEMDYLKEGIGLRAMAQRDPLIEYQREGFDMFTAMLDGIKEETVSLLFHVQVQVVPAEPAPAAEPEPVTAPQTAVEAPAPAPEPDPEATAALPAVFRGAAPAELSYSGPAEDGSTTRSRPAGNGHAGTPAKAGAPSRNRPCPCGSGRKYKQCHGSPTAARPKAARHTSCRWVQVQAGPCRSNRAASARTRPSMRHTAATSAASACGRHSRSRSSRDTPDVRRHARAARHRPSVPGSRRVASCSGGRLPSSTSTASRRVVPTERRTPWVSIGGGTYGSGGGTTRRTTTARAPGRGS